MKSSIAIAAAMQLALIALLSLSTPQVEGAAMKWPSEYLNDAKNFLLDVFKERIINRSEVIAKFEETMKIVRARYAEAENNGELAEMNEDEQQAFYYKIVVEETRKLRANVEAEKSNGASVDVTPIDMNKLPEEHKKILNDLEGEQKVNDAEEESLEFELDQIGVQEAEMGWSMTPEAKAAMKRRTKKLMTDLMSNEVRQLAMTILTSYFTGGPIAGAITTGVIANVKFRLVDYLMNSIVALVSAAMGREIKITQV